MICFNGPLPVDSADRIAASTKWYAPRRAHDASVRSCYYFATEELSSNSRPRANLMRLEYISLISRRHAEQDYLAKEAGDGVKVCVCPTAAWMFL